MNKIKELFRKAFYVIWRYYNLITSNKTLDIHVAEHCNLNCIGCFHYSPIAPESFVDVNDLFKTLSELKKRGADKVFKRIYLLGGEPLLHPEVNKVIEVIRSNFSLETNEIVILTNGILLKKMNKAFWETCIKLNIQIMISCYPINLNYKELAEFCSDNGIKIEMFRPDDVSYYFDEFKLNAAIQSRKWKNFIGCDLSSCYILNGNRIFPCSKVAYVEYLNKKLPYKFHQTQKDYLDIHRFSRLRFLLFCIRTKDFCKYCVFPRKRIRWAHSSGKLEEWVI